MIRLRGFLDSLFSCVPCVQFEITPFNVTYMSLIGNPYMNGTNMTHDLVDCSTSGVQSSVTASNATHSWTATLKLPWSLIGNVSDSSTPDRTHLGNVGFAPLDIPVWRINLFRVLMLTDTDFCTPSTCWYGAFSPTFVNPPAFHYPAYFAVMVFS